MRKSIIIIGAGMGGLAAGIYGQLNGYETKIFEMHSNPGGQCTAWKRKGYTFDACIHHLFGCAPGSIYQVWKELGAMPRDMVSLNECVSVFSADGVLFRDYYKLDQLEQELKRLATEDSKLTREYLNAIKLFTRHDMMDMMFNNSLWKRIKLIPAMLSTFKYYGMSLGRFGFRFINPFLRQAFPLLVYSMPETPIFLHFVRHAYGIQKKIQWPVGGALQFSESIAKRYASLGGKIQYKNRVTKILVENDRAVGVKLEDGSEHRADIVVSNADGRRTILELLEGKYTNEIVKGYCIEPADETIMGVQVFLGVNRDLSREPSAIIMLLENPVKIAGHEHKSIEMQTYGFDPSMAPAGKGVIKVELVSSYSFWKQLAADKEKYNSEKNKVANQVLEVIKSKFPGIDKQVEIYDVATLMTWERFMGGTHGWANFPVRKMKTGFSASSSDNNSETTLPGLSNFYFVGVWATMMGALFMNAFSGKRCIKTICRQDGKKFTAGQV